MEVAEQQVLVKTLRRWLGHSLVWLGVRILPDEEERAHAYADMRQEEILRESPHAAPEEP